MKYFATVLPPRDVRKAIAASVPSRLLAGCTPVDADRLHITVLYVGHVRPPDDETFAARCREVAGTTSQFPVTLRGLRVFPGARVAVAAVDTGQLELEQLWAQLNAATPGIGDATRIHPGFTVPSFGIGHVTIGHFLPDVADLPTSLDGEWQGPSFVAESLTVMASQEGQYSVVETARFVG